MRGLMVNTTALLLCSFFVVPAAAEAAVLIDEPFTGTALPAGFSLASGSSGQTPTYTASGIEFAGNGDGARNYVRTDDTDYHLVGMTAFLTVQTQLGKSFDDDSQLFFGLGTGVIGQYGVPDRQETDGMYLNLNNSGGLAAIQMTPAGRSELEVLDYISAADQTQVTVTAVRMIYDLAGGTIQYDVDFDYAGDGTYVAFSADQSIGPVDIPAATITAWNGGSPSSIVFGGDSDDNSRLVVRNLLVIPEPATLGVIGLGSMAMVLKRRRN